MGNKRSPKRRRRQFSPEDKATILRRHLADKVPVFDLCEESGHEATPGTSSPHLLCPCGETMRILSFLTDPPAVRKILRHLESQSSRRQRGSPPVGPEPSALAS